MRVATESTDDRLHVSKAANTHRAIQKRGGWDNARIAAQRMMYRAMHGMMKNIQMPIL
jgi:hypothetical protein